MNNHLDTKSVINRQAAQMLLKQGYYCSVVHCEYYSCIQLIMSKLLNFGFDDAKIHSEKERMSNQAKRNYGLHDCLIDLIKTHIKAKLSYTDSREFVSGMVMLRSLRVKSDYENVSILINNATDSIALSDNITQFLKKNL